MREEIKETELKRLNHYGSIFTVLLIITIVSFVPLAMVLSYYGFIISAVLFSITFYFALKVEKCKKDNNVQTYKEIVAFTEGKRLDEIEKHQEYAKRPYQKVLLVLGSAFITLLVCVVLHWLLKGFL